jgi:hypothetical protein
MRCDGSRGRDHGVHSRGLILVVETLPYHPRTSASAHRQLENSTPLHLVVTFLRNQTTTSTPQKIIAFKTLGIPFVALLQLIHISLSGHETFLPASRASWPTQHHMTTPCPHHPRKSTFNYKPHNTTVQLRNRKLSSITAQLLRTRTPRDQLHEMPCTTHLQGAQPYHLVGLP